jgi:hypothetical protein
MRLIQQVAQSDRSSDIVTLRIQSDTQVIKDLTRHSRIYEVACPCVQLLSGQPITLSSASGFPYSSENANLGELRYLILDMSAIDP